jgi:apolipoprotein N-acyltransferase
VGRRADAPDRRPARLGLGLGHFTVGSYWMVEAFFVPPADFARSGRRRCSAWRRARAFPAAAAWAPRARAALAALGGRYRG